MPRARRRRRLRSGRRRDLPRGDRRRGDGQADLAPGARASSPRSSWAAGTAGGRSKRRLHLAPARRRRGRGDLGGLGVGRRARRPLDLAREARARVLKLAARGDVATHRGRARASSAGNRRPALELARRLWTMEPSSSVAEELFLRAWLRGLGAAALPGGARAWLPRLGSLGGSMRLTRGAFATRPRRPAPTCSRSTRATIRRSCSPSRPTSSLPASSRGGSRVSTASAPPPAYSSSLLDYLARHARARWSETIVGLTALESGQNSASARGLRATAAGAEAEGAARHAVPRRRDLRARGPAPRRAHPRGQRAARHRLPPAGLLAGHGAREGGRPRRRSRQARRRRARQGGRGALPRGRVPSRHLRRRVAPLAICRRAWTRARATPSSPGDQRTPSSTTRPRRAATASTAPRSSAKRTPRSIRLLPGSRTTRPPGSPSCGARARPPPSRRAPSPMASIGSCRACRTSSTGRARSRCSPRSR